MDKLEPVIRHRFWILLGLCLPLIVYGYMSASGAMQAETEKREGELEEAYSKVPSGGPNETWQQGLHEINEKLDLEVALAHYGILQKQQEDMDWPPGVAPYVPDEYRGDFEREAGFFYVDEYEKLLRDAYLIAEPIMADSKGGYTGKVSFAYEIMPRHEFGRSELSISSERMWDAEEDIWFLRLLLQAVRDVNANADNIAKAPLRMINTLKLMGGDGQLGGSTTAAAGGFSGGEETDMEGLMEMMRGGEFEEDSEESDLFGMGGMGANVDVAFDPAEEFGNDISTQAAPAGGADPGTVTGSTREELRYIALDENQPYRERGFYMSVLINQQRIPDFLTTLSNSRWPIRIVRFHVGPNPHGGSRSAAAMGQSAYDGADYGDYEGYDAISGLNDDVMDYDPSGYGAGPAYGPQQNQVNRAALSGAFSHPDLVQLEVLGAITFFNPLPEDVLAKVQTALEGMGASAAVPPGAEPPLTPPSEGAATEDESPATEDGTSTPPAADDSDAATDGQPAETAAPTS